MAQNLKKLRIVMVMIEAPLPFGNAASRWFYVLLRELKKRGHEVTALAACKSEEEIKKTKEIFPVVDYDLHLFPFPQNRNHLSKLWAKAKSLVAPYSYMFSSEFKKKLNEVMAKDVDILHLEQLWSGHVGARWAHKAVINVHHLIMIDQEFIQGGSQRERLSRKLAFQTEQRLLKKFPFIRSCSPRLIPKISEFNPQAKVYFVPVGLDFSLYRYIPAEKRQRQPVLGLIGNMGWYPTYSSARRLLDKLWPIIYKKLPQCRLLIVGWQAKAQLQDYLNLPGVEILENVPDIETYFARSSVFIYTPARGSGMKIKILEAMNFGVPVVTTSEGIEGLPAEDGVHAFVADSDEVLAEKALKLLVDFELQEKMRLQARKLMEEVIGPTPTVNQIEQIYKEIINSQEKNK